MWKCTETQTHHVNWFQFALSNALFSSHSFPTFRTCISLSARISISSLFITFLMLLKAVQCYNGCERISIVFRRCAPAPTLFGKTIQENYFLPIEWMVCVCVYLCTCMSYLQWFCSLFFTRLQPNKWIPHFIMLFKFNAWPLISVSVNMNGLPFITAQAHSKTHKNPVNTEWNGTKWINSSLSSIPCTAKCVQYPRNNSMDWDGNLHTLHTTHPHPHTHNLFHRHALRIVHTLCNDLWSFHSVLSTIFSTQYLYWE